MALATYADLLTTVQSYEDDTSSVVTGVVADMVTLAEQRIFLGDGAPGDSVYLPPLRVRGMEKTSVFPAGPGLDGGTSTGSANAHTVTLATAPSLARGQTITFTAGYSCTGPTTLDDGYIGVTAIRKGASRDELEAGDILADGVYTVYYDGTYQVLMPSDGAFPLPANFLGVKAAYIQDRGQILSYMPATGINSFMDGAVSDTPCYYAIEGDCMRLEPLPAESCNISVTYFSRPVALSVALNDIFRNAPSIYLWATLLELAIHLPNEGKIGFYREQLNGALKAYMRADNMARTGHAPLRVRFRLAP